MNNRPPKDFDAGLITSIAQKELLKCPDLNKEDKQDYIQDVKIACFVACRDHEANNDPISNPWAFFSLIANCRRINIITRKRYKTVPVVNIDEVPEQGLQDLNIENDPAASQIRQEIANNIKSALIKRNPHLWDVWQLFRQGYSHEEIAQALGISNGMSRYRIHEIKHYLKNLDSIKHLLDPDTQREGEAP